MTQQFKVLPLAQLQRGRYQPRINFDETALDELAHSIKTQGQLEPIVVREVAFQHYEIIAGERRWRAAARAGLTEIACVIGVYSDAEAASLTLVENLQRQALNLIEEAEGYRRLIDEFCFSQHDIAVLVSKSRSHVANILRLLQLSREVQSRVQTGELSFGHARVLVGMTVDLQCKLALDAIKNDWSVRTLEAKAKAIKSSPNVIETNKDADIADLESKLAEQVGAPIEITDDGWLKVRFFDNETLAGILERMGLRYD